MSAPRKAISRNTLAILRDKVYCVPARRPTACFIRVGDTRTLKL